MEPFICFLSFFFFPLSSHSPPSFFSPPTEKADGVYASIFVNEQARITSSQDYRVLYDYTAQVSKGFQLNISYSARFKTADIDANVLEVLIL